MNEKELKSFLWPFKTREERKTFIQQTEKDFRDLIAAQYDSLHRCMPERPLKELPDNLWE